MPIHTRLFVYGTLLQGERNHAQLGRSRCLGAGRTVPRFELVDLGSYPALLDGGSTAVEGEIYAVTPLRLALLDRFEGVPELYLRRSIELDDGTQVAAYLINPHLAAGAPRIVSGSWKRRHDS